MTAAYRLPFLTPALPLHAEVYPRHRAFRVVPVAFALVLSACPRGASAQVVRGLVHQSADAQAVAGALVSLVDSAGVEWAQSLSNASGAYFLRAPRPGVYRLRVERIGYRAATSPPLRLAAGDTLTYDVRASVRAVSLGAIEVKAKRRCVVRPAQGEAVATVWNEARKALEMARRTTNQGLVRYDLRTYQRRLGPKAEHVLNQRSKVLHGTGERPFESLPAAQLMAQGFIAKTKSSRIYYAPDPNVLLSDEFLDTHCLRLATDPRDTTVIGVEFDPVRGRRVTDISGTLWLDRSTDELRTLRFHYLDDLDRAMESSALGGYERFEALPSGVWVIRRWWIRGPLVRVHRLAYGDVRRELAGIEEIGGQVTDLRVAGVSRFRSRVGVLAGVVWDSLRGKPLTRATIRLHGTGYAATTDSAGKFLLTGIAGGTYDVGFSHPELDSLGVDLPRRAVRISAGDTTHVVLAVPSPTTLLAAGCPDSARAKGRGILVGTARDSLTGSGLPGTRIELSWGAAPHGGATPGREVVADAAGHFRACGVPAGVRLTLRAQVLGRTRRTTVTVASGTVVRHDVAFALPTTQAMPLKPMTVTVESSRAKERRARGGDVNRLTEAQIDSLSRGTHDVEALLQNAHMLGITVTTTQMLQAGGTGVCIEDDRTPPPLQNAHQCRMVLVLVDGVQMDEPQTDLFSLDTRDIAEIDYLPPVEAATRFGTAGGNGALLITTRSGHGGG